MTEVTEVERQVTVTFSWEKLLSFWACFYGTWTVESVEFQIVWKIERKPGAAERKGSLAFGLTFEEEEDEPRRGRK